MKRKNFAMASGLLVALSLTFSPAFADDAHHPEKSGAAAAGNQSAAAQAPEKATPADEAGKQLTKAQALMQRIEQTRDPAERQRLMQEHLQAMREGMGMMRGMGAMGGMGGMGGMGAGMMMGQGPAGSGKGMSGDKAGGMMGCDMMAGHAMMEKRIDMMQQMMEQMLRRDAAREAMPRP
jgi:hypothetical protein